MSPESQIVASTATLRGLRNPLAGLAAQVAFFIHSWACLSDSAADLTPNFQPRAVSSHCGPAVTKTTANAGERRICCHQRLGAAGFEFFDARALCAVTLVAM